MSKHPKPKAEKLLKMNRIFRRFTQMKMGCYSREKTEKYSHKKTQKAQK